MNNLTGAADTIETSIINSALWAAAGDAVGWISELTDAKGLRRRAGTDSLLKPVAWKRKIGGIGGVMVELPSGTYSDDTQLRLSVSRAIRSDGTFDVEIFAKIELPVWQSYSLGAGKGSRAAAANLSKRDVNWFSNFYVYDGSKSYVDGGGNGAAMRIQPHVWRRVGKDNSNYLDDVVKDSIVTHGNMRGICGAVFHACCLAFCFKHGEVPGPSEWIKFIDGFHEIADVVHRDFQLSRFWLNTWEHLSKKKLASAILDVALECQNHVQELLKIHWSEEHTYTEILECLGSFSNESKGTGTNTAIAAAALAWTCRDSNKSNPERAILYAANAIGSDTDTIGTMVGALIGAIADGPPSWPIQDYDYIVLEARRMAGLSRGETVQSYNYPDLMGWQAPSTLSDAVAVNDGRFFLSGLGSISPRNKPWISGDFVWQWFSTKFGQTLLCKFRSELREVIGVGAGEIRSDLRRIASDKAPLSRINREPELPFFEKKLSIETKDEHPTGDIEKDLKVKTIAPSIEELTELVIQSNFDPTTIGNCLLVLAEDSLGIEKSIAFSSVIVKALTARRRRLQR